MEIKKRKTHTIKKIIAKTFIYTMGTFILRNVQIGEIRERERGNNRRKQKKTYSKKMVMNLSKI